MQEHKSLKDRHKAEEKFHDAKYSGEQTGPAHYAFHPTYKIFQCMMEMMGDLHGRRVLECGCGTGWITVELAGAGADVDSFDISGQAVSETIGFLERHGHKNCRVRKMSAEELLYDGNTFDIVLGFAILHHLDLDKSLPELHRVLKPGGVAYFAEPLGENFLINLYRKFTPQHRTEDEHPLILKEITNDLRHFSSIEHKEYYLTAILPFMLAYIPLLKKSYPFFYKIFWAVDRMLLQVFPFLGRWAWYSILIFKK